MNPHRRPIFPTHPHNHHPTSPAPSLFLLCLLGFLFPLHSHLPAQTPGPLTPHAPEFEQANKLYEQANYEQAAQAYHQLSLQSPNNPTLAFNLGNAWFKAAHPGLAIAAYRHAQRLLPRDPAIRFNLNFVRKQVTGSEAPSTSLWQRALATLTLNEWTLLSSTTLCAWFLLLCLREYKPSFRPALSGYTAAAGTLTLLLAAGLATASLQQTRTEAVVTVRDAIVRYGPLQESQVFFQLRDGSELKVLDQKEVLEEGQTQTWLRIQGRDGRIGWLKRDQVVLLPLTDHQLPSAAASGWNEPRKEANSRCCPANWAGVEASTKITDTSPNDTKQIRLFTIPSPICSSMSKPLPRLSPRNIRTARESAPRGNAS